MNDKLDKTNFVIFKMICTHMMLSRKLQSLRFGDLVCYAPELSMDRNRNLFRQVYIDFLGTGAGMELFCGLQEQEFR